MYCIFNITNTGKTILTVNNTINGIVKKLNYDDFIDEQNLTDNDMKICPNYTDPYEKTQRLRKYQLAEIIKTECTAKGYNITYRVIDARNIKHLFAANSVAKRIFGYKHHNKQGKTHKTATEYRKTHDYSKSQPLPIDMSSDYDDYADIIVPINKIKTRNIWDEFVARNENNWKQKKIRKQYMWHKNIHKAQSKPEPRYDSTWMD